MNVPNLSIYLNDHLAMFTGEMELAQRTARENESTQLGMFLHRYVGEVSEQKRGVEHLLNTIGEEPSMAKQAAGWILEKVGRLKMNNSLTTYSDLSRLLEVEMLSTLATSRLYLWQTLKPHGTDTCFSTASGDFARFVTETQRQIEALEEHRSQAAGKAFGAPPTPAAPEVSMPAAPVPADHPPEVPMSSNG